MISRLMSKNKSASSFNFDALCAPPLLALLSANDIVMIEDVCRDPRLNSKVKEKREIINNILEPRGFKRFASGTNRIAYKFLEDQSILLKVPISRGGLEDSINEYRNQFLIKPFVAKCFEVSPYGALGLFERVSPVTSIEQYLSMAYEIFNLINEVTGKYIMADVGTKFFMNIGIRNGFGPIFIDYPMLYELDGRKLFCNVSDPLTGIPCGGAIDFDDGFNFLYCKKCGKQYLAKQLAKGNYGNDIIFKGRKETSQMKITTSIGDKVINTTNSIVSSDTYVTNVRRKKEEEKRRTLKVSVYNPIESKQKTEEKIIPKEDIKESVEKTNAVNNEVSVSFKKNKNKKDADKKPNNESATYQKKIKAPFPASTQYTLVGSNMEMNCEEEENENNGTSDNKDIEKDTEQTKETSSLKSEEIEDKDTEEEVKYVVKRRPEPEEVPEDFNENNY